MVRNEQEKSIWLINAEKVGLSVILDFAETIEPLRVREADVHGDILVGGPGSAFPERLLLCTPGSGFFKMRSCVNSLTCCDSEFFTNPSIRLEHDVDVLLPGTKPKLENQAVVYYPYVLQLVLPLMPSRTFDTALFFRIVNLDEQLEELVPLVSRVLKPNGKFLGSGRFDDEDKLRSISEDWFVCESVKKLPNPDYSGYHFRKHHLGFVLSRKL